MNDSDNTFATTETVESPLHRAQAVGKWKGGEVRLNEEWHCTTVEHWRNSFPSTSTALIVAPEGESNMRKSWRFCQKI